MGYTFMWTTYETETWTYLQTVNAINLHWNCVTQFIDSIENLTYSWEPYNTEFYIIFLSIELDLFAAKIAGYTLYQRHTSPKRRPSYRQQMQEICIEIALHTARFNQKFNNFPRNI